MLADCAEVPNADPNERRYCYCDQISRGEMIACDAPRCKREWFHLKCTNLTAAPEGKKKWFCDDCTQKNSWKRNR
ncbi:plan Homeodomain finger of tumor Supressor Ing4 [Mycena capillaripes]|nr:plan Homeodomain finger of tumor Supressor Ing4 [Mycena capillaripes]KAJ6533151.1 plan Homeodomain finger of tumor Supressor Ing4 [Mycena capillaripes]